MRCWNAPQLETVRGLAGACSQHATKPDVALSITILDTLPENAIGKVDKLTLRTQT